MGCVYRRGTIYWIKYHRAGRAYFESANSEKKDDATTLLRLREGDLARGVPVSPKIGRLTFEEARDDFLTDRRLNGRGPFAKLEGRIANHLTPYFGGWRMATIGAADVRSYTIRRKDAGAANGTINRELTILKRMFSLAIQGEKLLRKPHIQLLREDNVRTGFFEPDQYESLIRHLPDDIRPVIEFAYITGWRVNSEILTLQWRQVDLRAGEVRLDPGSTKNREGRVFPLTPELRGLLDRRLNVLESLKADGLICPWVFFRLVAHGRHGPKRPVPIRAFRKAWKTACRAAGCPARIPHDLRRTAVRNMVRVGIPERVAMQLTGHKTRSVFERYNIVSGGDLRDACKRLEGIGETVASSIVRANH